MKIPGFKRSGIGIIGGVLRNSEQISQPSSAIEYLKYWCDRQTHVNPLLNKYRPIAFVSRNSLSRNTITVSPSWTTSHSRNLRVQRDTKGLTYKCLLTTNKNLIWDVLSLTSNQMKVMVWRTWVQDCLIKGIHIPLQMRSHGLGMTPVSIKQPRATLWQKSIRSQKQSETKLDGSLK
jgi:hypothetical protein